MRSKSSKSMLLRFPDSANVYDSLSDAYLEAGEQALAREYAQKAIDALARDTTSPDALKNQIRQSAMQKLTAGAPGTNQTAAQPSRDESIRMPIVLRVPGMADANPFERMSHR